MFPKRNFSALASEQSFSDSILAGHSYSSPQHKQRKIDNSGFSPGGIQSIQMSFLENTDGFEDSINELIQQKITEKITEQFDEALNTYVPTSSLACETSEMANGKKKNISQQNRSQSSVSGLSQNGADLASVSSEIAKQVLEHLTPVIAKSISTAVSTAVAALLEKCIVECSAKILDNVSRHLRCFQYDLDRLEQYSRRETVRIIGLPEQEGEDNENLKPKIVQMCANMDVNLQANEISVCHRNGKKLMGKPRPILCKFISRQRKMDLMTNKKKVC